MVGWREHIGSLPRVPREIGLGLSRHETPVNRADVVLLGEGKNRVEGAAIAARHVLRADDGTMQRLKRSHPGFEAFGPVVVVEGDDVGLSELDLGDGVLLGWVGPVTVPETAGERLGRMRRARPGKCLGKKRGDEFRLVLRFIESFVVGDYRARSRCPSRGCGRLWRRLPRLPPRRTSAWARRRDR